MEHVYAGGCIDLTANDTLDGDIIDLTDANMTANNSAFDADPVVVGISALFFILYVCGHAVCP